MKKKLLLIYSAMVVKNNPKNTTRFNGILALFLMVMGMGVSWGQFTSGNIIVEQVGDGATTLGSAATKVKILEFTTTGTPGNNTTYFGSTLTPTGAPYNLVDSGSATSNGYISLSTDKTFVVVPGYNAPTGTTSIASSAATTYGRTIGKVTSSGSLQANGTFNIITGNNYRSIVSNGSGYWLIGALGIFYTNSDTTNGTPASPTSTIFTTNTRIGLIFNNTLFADSSSASFNGSGSNIGIYQIGTYNTLPTSTVTAGTAINIINTGTGSSPYGFSFSPNGLTCYIADDRATTSGGIQKWSYSGTFSTTTGWSGGAWSLAYTLSTGVSNIGARGIVVDYSGANPIIYGTSAETLLNRIFKITDTGLNSSASTIATANSNFIFRGICFAPSANNWIGGNGNWNLGSNWSLGTIPISTDDVTIKSGSPILDTDFTIGGSGSLTISGTGTLTINPGKKLTIAGTADFGGKAVIIRSDNSGTGAIGQVTGTLTGATNVTVERYIPGKRAWRALTAPLKGDGGSIFSQWQNNGSSGTATATGVEIWSNAPTHSSVTLNSGGTNSLLSYGSTGWNPITDTNSELLFTSEINKPFMVFVTGPYGSNTITSSFSDTTLKATGALITGTQSYSTNRSQYTFIGNPYASPLDLSVMMNNTQNPSASFGGNVWVWDANVSGSNQVGTYNLYNSGTYTNLTSNTAIGTGTQIQSGQAFFVKSTDGASFTIQESHKGSTFSNAVFRTGTLPELFRIGLYKQVNNEWSGRDGAMTVILSDADANQAPNKMANSTENIAFTKHGASFASNHHLPLNATDVLNVKVWNTTAGANYKLKLNTEEFSASNLEAILEDLFTNSRTPLALDGTAVEYPFTVTTDALSTGDRFRIVFQSSLLGTTLPTASGFSIIPNPVTGDSFQVNLGTLVTGAYSYSICNAIGQEVAKGTINNAAQNTNYEVKMSNSATGIYIMKIKGSDNSVFTAKIIKK